MPTNLRAAIRLRRLIRRLGRLSGIAFACSALALMAL